MTQILNLARPFFAKYMQYPFTHLKNSKKNLKSSGNRRCRIVSSVLEKSSEGVFLTKIPLGIVNFHPAPSPDYKGIGGYNLALLNNVDSWAVTAHYIDEKIDTGPITG